MTLPPIKRCVCTKCKHHLTAKEISPTFQNTGKRGKSASIILCYQCRVCSNKGYIEVEASAYWDTPMRPKTYQDLFKLGLNSYFVTENDPDKQLKFERINSKPITEEECKRFSEFIWKCEQPLKALGSPKQK